MTAEEARAHALKLHPDCEFAVVHRGLDIWLNSTWQVDLWRNEECSLAGDPRRHMEHGYKRDKDAILA